jgi:hypothetical protein
MEPLWGRFRSFIRSTYQERFMEAMSGCIMGLWGGRHILFLGLPVWLSHIIIGWLWPLLTGSWVIIKGLALASLSSLATSYMGWFFKKKIEPRLNRAKHKNSNHVEQSQKRRKKGGGTAA